MLKPIARLFGYELVRKTKMPNLEAHLLKILNYYKPDVVLDVGANVGQFGQLIRNLGFSGHIISFEPVESCVTTLKEVAKSDPLWRVCNFALGSYKHQFEINVFDKSVFSSILPPSDFAKLRYDHMNHPRKQTIDVETLDDFADKNGLAGKRIFLKIDTQGYDLEVFRGGRNTMKDVLALMTEVSFEALYDGMPNYHEALGEMEGSGFSVSGFFPITRRGDGGLIEMDCVMVNKAFGIVDFPR